MQFEGHNFLFDFFYIAELRFGVVTHEFQDIEWILLYQENLNIHC